MARETHVHRSLPGRDLGGSAGWVMQGDRQARTVTALEGEKRAGRFAPLERAAQMHRGITSGKVGRAAERGPGMVT
jgi:hypothetical protein